MSKVKKMLANLFLPERFRIRAEAAAYDVFHIYHGEWKWRKTAKAHLKVEPVCQACATTKKLEVHHIKTWHLYPDLRYTASNLITLCRPCHFRYGHYRNWRSMNPDIVAVTSILQYVSPVFPRRREEIGLPDNFKQVLDQLLAT